MSPEVSRDILRGWNIVVVDDDPDSLDVASMILEFYGANVHSASDGKEGLALIRSIRPRFIISDLSMPMMDGWGLIDELKRDPLLAEIPVVALTAHAMMGHREKAIAKGFHNYLTKPLTPETFIHDLLSLLIDIPVLAVALKQ
jgi:two-component system cell cycle response regulator DivK